MVGGWGWQMLTFAYIVGGWVKQDAYVIKKKITEKRISRKHQIYTGRKISKAIFLSYNSSKKEQSFFLPLKRFKSKAIILVLIMELINVFILFYIPI